MCIRMWKENLYLSHRSSQDGLKLFITVAANCDILLAEAMGRSIEDIYKGNDEGVLADVELNRTITETSRAAIGAMVRTLTGRDGRVSLRNSFGCSMSTVSASANTLKSAGNAHPEGFLIRQVCDTRFAARVCLDLSTIDGANLGASQPDRPTTRIRQVG